MKSRKKNLIIIGSGDQAHIIADEVKRKKEFKILGAGVKTPSSSTSKSPCVAISLIRSPFFN